MNSSPIPFPTPASDTASKDTLGYRILPHNMEAEQALLGTLLIKNTLLEQVGETLRAEYFFDPSHKKIYTAICTLIDKGQVANPVVLKNYFANDETLENIGGADYLAELASSVISIINAADYAKLIHELYLKRELIDMGETLVNKAYDHDLDAPAQAQIEECEKQLFELATLGDMKGGFEKFTDSINNVIKMAEEASKRKGKLTGVTTGMRDLDKLLGGLQKTDLLILAGRPSMGKTSLATNIACNAAKAYALNNGKEGAVVGFFSLEMSAEQLALRIIAEESRIPSHRIRKGEIEKDEFERLSNASNQLKILPIFTDDTPAITMSTLRSRARRLKRNQGLDMIVVDYLQLLRASLKTSENRVLEISEITRGLKAIAKELEIPVLALSQLSRAVEQREDKRPQLSDLRESGSIEQDADIVMFVYREEYYHERTIPNKRPEEDAIKFQEKLNQWEQHGKEIKSMAEIIIAKQRQGPIGTVKLHFNADLTKFSDLETIHTEQY